MLPCICFVWDPLLLTLVAFCGLDTLPLFFLKTHRNLGDPRVRQLALLCTKNGSSNRISKGNSICRSDWTVSE